MTDNRTNVQIVDDAADEQVEAAAKALFASGKQGNVWIITHGKPWEETWSEYRKAFRESARAALEAAARAAQGAAPQAESDERIQAWERLVEHPVWRSCFGEERPLIDSMMERIDKLAELEMTVNELAPAPVLPSSGVDEDALAEADALLPTVEQIETRIKEAEHDWRNAEFVGDPVLGTPTKHVAHAVRALFVEVAGDDPESV